jgi:hypothetical protein
MSTIGSAGSVVGSRDSSGFMILNDRSEKTGSGPLVILGRSLGEEGTLQRSKGKQTSILCTKKRFSQASLPNINYKIFQIIIIIFCPE